MTDAVPTTNHTVIRRWVESREGRPVKSANGALRIDFKVSEEEFEAIGWDEFFVIFEQRRLAFLHQDLLENGGPSRFNTFVERQ